MIRRAAFTDIPRMAALLVQASEESRYGETDIEVDVKHTKGILMNAIQRHDGKGEGATLCLVSERDGVVEGLIVGMACRIQEIVKTDHLQITDLFFYQSKKANAGDAYKMLKSVVDWGKAMGKGYEFLFGVTDVIGDYEDITVLYKRLGLTQRGVLYGARAEP